MKLPSLHEHWASGDSRLAGPDARFDVASKVTHQPFSAAVVTVADLVAAHALSWTVFADRKMGAGLDELAEPPSGWAPGLKGGVERAELPGTIGPLVLGTLTVHEVVVPGDLTQGMMAGRHNTVASVLASNFSEHQMTVEIIAGGMRMSFEMAGADFSNAYQWSASVDIGFSNGQWEVRGVAVRNAVNRRSLASTPDRAPPPRERLGLGRLDTFAPSNEALGWIEALDSHHMPDSLRTAVLRTLRREPGVTQPEVELGGSARDERGYLLARIDDDQGRHATVFFVQQPSSGALSVDVIRYRQELGNGVTNQLFFRDPQVPARPSSSSSRQAGSTSSLPSTATDVSRSSGEATANMLGRRARDDSEASSNSLRSVRARLETARIDPATDFTIQQQQPFFLFAQLPERGGCPAAVINHLFQALLLTVRDMPAGTLMQTQQRIAQLSGGVPLLSHLYLVREDAPEQLNMAIEAMRGPLENACGAPFEVGNVSDAGGAGTHQVTLRLIADRTGQPGGSHWWVLDSRDPDAPADQPRALARRFGDLGLALRYIAGRTRQPDGTLVLSAYVPSAPLPPVDPQGRGGDLPRIGWVRTEDLRDDERTALVARAHAFVAPGGEGVPAEGSPQRTRTEAPTTSTTEPTAATTALPPPSEILQEWNDPDEFGFDDFPFGVDPLARGHELITGFGQLTDVTNQVALLRFYDDREQPPAPDSPRIDTPLRFLASLERRGSGGTAQPLNVDTYLALPFREQRRIAREFVETHRMGPDRSARRQELSVFLEAINAQANTPAWRNPPVPDNWDAQRGQPTWEQLITNLRDPDTNTELSPQVRDAVLRHYRRQALAGATDGTLYVQTPALVRAVRGLVRGGETLQSITVERAQRALPGLPSGDRSTLDRFIRDVRDSDLPRRPELDEENRGQVDQAVRWLLRDRDPRSGTVHSSVMISDQMAIAFAPLERRLRAQPNRPSLSEAARSGHALWRESAMVPGSGAARGRALHRMFAMWAHVQEFSRSATHRGADAAARATAHVEQWIAHRMVDTTACGIRGGRPRFEGTFVIELARLGTDAEWNAQIDTYVARWPERADARESLDAFRAWLRHQDTIRGGTDAPV